MANATTKQNSTVEDKRKKMNALKEQMRKVEDKLKEDNISIEKERIETLVCLYDEEDLSIPPEIVDEFIVMGTTSKDIVCPICEMINRITVRFTEEPEIGTAIITQEEHGFAYIVRNIAELTDEQLVKRVDFLVDELESGKVRFTPEMQLILRMFQLFYKGKGKK